MEFWVDIRDGIIHDMSYEVFGCKSPLLCAKTLAGMVKKKTLDEIIRLDVKELLDALPDLLPEEEHCVSIGNLKGHPK